VTSIDDHLHSLNDKTIIVRGVGSTTEFGTDENGLPKEYVYPFDEIATITIVQEAPKITISGPPLVLDPTAVPDHVDFTISLDYAADYPITVKYSTVDGTAIAGTNYVSQTGSHTFAPGETSWKFPVALINSPNIVSISGKPDPSSVLEPDSGTRPVVYTISLKDPTGPTQFQVRLSEPSSAADHQPVLAKQSETATLNGESVTVDYATFDGSATAGEDFVALSGSHTFLPGEVSWDFKVDVIGETKPEDNPERFTVMLSNPRSTGGPTPILDFAHASVSTAISDPPILSKAADVTGLLAQVFDGTGNLINVLVQLSGDAQIPMIAEDLNKINNVLGPAAQALGWGATVITPATNLSANLAAANALSGPLAQRQAEWVAHREFDVEVHNELAKAAFTSVAAAYLASYTTAAATAGGLELALLSFGASAGLAAGAVPIAAIGALIVGGYAAQEIYNTFYEPTIKANLKDEFERAYPMPTSGDVPPQSKADATTGIGGTASGNVLAHDPFTISSVTPFVGPGAHGNLTLKADGSFTYAVTDLSGPTGSHLHDLFIYNVADGHGGALSGSLDITLNRAPVITVPLTNAPAIAHQSFAASSLFSASDADGDTLSYYLYDANSVANSGHFVVNGTVVPPESVYSLSAAQLAQTSFVAGVAGTADELRVIAFDGQTYSNNSIFTYFHVNVPGSMAVNDFNGNQKSDILWRNDAGVVAIWDMNGGNLVASNSLGAIPASWKIANSGDFSGDGKSDILWRNDSGALSIWEMDDGVVLRGTSLGSVPDNWKIVDTGDFNGDHKSDILWRNDAGMVTIWDMNGGNLLASNSLGLVPTSWKIAGAADFNGDSKSDILWRNDSGALSIWEMDDGSVLRANPLGSVPDNWKIADTGDFNGDHKSDILWRNDAGMVTIWDMNGGNLVASNSLGLVPTSWKIANSGDYGGDGKSDILWRNDSGALSIWEMDDGVVLRGTSLGSVPDNWHIIV
jgi:hypothetical protein